MQKTSELLVLNASDNVAVAMENVSCGAKYNELDLIIEDEIPSAHKIALINISKGENIIKYGYPIGYASQNIKKGQHVHVHNIKTNLDDVIEYVYQPVADLFNKQDADSSNKQAANPQNQPAPTKKTFTGYLRENGEAGIRNEIWIIPTVGCINKMAERTAALANEKFKDEVDGVFAFPHPFGCGQIGDDEIRTQKILAGLVNNPNAAGVLVLGLGCEKNLIELFKPFLGEINPKRVKFLVTQDSGDEIEDSIELISQLVKYAKTFKQRKLSAGKLKIGLNCGGSDGFSGITANPLTGRVSDMVIDCGGTVIMTEVPEFFGAETILMNRSKNEEVFSETVLLINDFKNYFINHGYPIYENPSPGNIEGGISTLEEKSLGGIQKGGTGQVTAVLDCGQKSESPGLNLLKGPGNDSAANTLLAASGAQIILFTTGRGTPIGGPVPTVKISSNTTLAKNKPHWIDFDAGVILKGVEIECLGDKFFDYILDVVSNEKTPNNEKNEYREIAMFKDGVMM